MMRTDGTPLEAARSATRTVAEGDVERNPDTRPRPLRPACAIRREVAHR